MIDELTITVELRRVHVLRWAFEGPLRAAWMGLISWDLALRLCRGVIEWWVPRFTRIVR